MLNLHLDVALALVLSVASTVLCVGYGLTRWNADDDPDEDLPNGVTTPSETGRSNQKELDGV